MRYSNQISTSIPKKDLDEILNAIDFIDNKLSDLVSLSNEEIAALPKLRSNTLDFVFNCLHEAEEHPELMPEGIELDEIRKDAELINSINSILGPLKALTKKLEDSQLLAGSEAYLPSIAIHNTLMAVKDTNRVNKSFAL